MILLISSVAVHQSLSISFTTYEGCVSLLFTNPTTNTITGTRLMICNIHKFVVIHVQRSVDSITFILSSLVTVFCLSVESSSSTSLKKDQWSVDKFSLGTSLWT